MIFVVLGTQKFQLNRLLKMLDEYVYAGYITERVVAQIGHSTYKPQHFEYQEFMDKEEFDRTVSEADVIIAHSGVGTIMTAINAKKPVIVYPRLAKYKEHVDNHQLDIARAFETKQYVLCCYEEDDLYEKIKEAKQFQFQEYVSHREKIVSLIKNFLDEE